jgi:hypothetical protein
MTALDQCSVLDSLTIPSKCKVENTNALDWPLTHNEKKTQIFRLYSYDLRAADTEVERLRAAVESAAAVLRAIKPDDNESESEAEAECSPRKPRARSEGAQPKCVQPIKPALCRTPRGERCAKPKRKVSFGGQPEEEPVHPIMTDSEDEVGTTKVSSHPKKHRDSIKLQKERTYTTACDADEDEPEQAEWAQSTAPLASVTTNREARPGIKAHLPWLVSLVLAAFLAKSAFLSESPSPPQPPMPLLPSMFGDSSCWVSGFRPEFCCLGYGGNPDCWDADHTYERCCLGRNP